MYIGGNMIKNMSTEAFITECTILINKLIKEYKINLGTNDIIPKFYSVFTEETNKKFNDRMLSFIAEFYQNNRNISTYYDPDMIENIESPLIRTIIFNYMEEFKNNDLYTIDNGKYIINPEKITFPFDTDQNGIKTTNLESIMNCKRENSNNYLTLIITKDGKTYRAPTSHATLYIWLNMLGIDTKNAIRIEWYGPQNNFDISSFARYEYNDNQENEKCIEITATQAESIMAIINTLDAEYPQYAFSHPDNSSLLAYLEKSDNLGLSPWNYNPRIADHNLSMLYRYTNHNTSFNKTKYLKALYDAAKEF